MNNNLLYLLDPVIRSQLHPTKNNDITNLTKSTYLWWQCPLYEDHVWNAMLKQRINGYGCSYCAGKKVSLSGCLATLRPDIVDLWYKEKNTITPFDVAVKSNKRVWFKCPVAEDHVWEARIADVTDGHGCPYCTGRKVCMSTCLATTHPHLVNSWHPDNPITPYDITHGSKRKFLWKCEKDHVWESAMCDRAGGHGCPYCSGRRPSADNCLSEKHPEIIKLWHKTKNNFSPYEVVKLKSKFWAQCEVSDDHAWETNLHELKRGRRCPYCAGKKVCLSNCLATNFPEVMDIWHEKNKVTPYDVTSGSNRKFFFRCKKFSDHEWESTACEIRRGRGCPYCVNKKVCLSNCLATTHSHLIESWHPDNELTPYDVTFGSSKEIIWQCSKFKKHTWLSPINRRVNAQGCPKCTTSKGENTIVSILENMNLKFETQVKFSTCRNKHELPFDFVIKSNNKIMLIEYNGMQHYEPVRWSNTMTEEAINIRFKRLKQRDSIKKDWAEKNNIPLLVIPYWDYENLERIIKSFVERHI